MAKTTIKMNKIFFIIGASGAGKITVVEKIEKMLPEFKTIYFDSIGIPSFEEMNQHYGGPEEFQRVKTVE